MQDVVIRKYNEKGEGVADGADGPLLVPFTLVGEGVRVTPADQGHYATLNEVLVPSPHRQSPPCPYFGVCGGCQLQHMKPTAYENFKVQLVKEAFQKQGLEKINLPPLVSVPSHTRRRINVRVYRHGTDVRVGFHRRRSHDVVDVETCLLLDPQLDALLLPLKTLGERILTSGQTLHAFLTVVDEGLDVMVVMDTLTGSQKQQIATWAETYPIVRLCIKHGKTEDLLLQVETPHVSFSGIKATFPQQGFLQPSVAGEQAMVNWIIDLLPRKHKAICDLFCGLGTFTLPLSQHGTVTGFEGSVQAVQFLTMSIQSQNLSHPVVAHHRDLFLYPLSFQELNAFDVVVLDPPRAGAYQQVRRLCKSDVPTIFMVSCNAHTFARDAAILKTAGYTLKEIQLVDQFTWSPHVEIVSLFEKKR